MKGPSVRLLHHITASARRCPDGIERSLMNAAALVGLIYLCLVSVTFGREK